MCSGAMLHEDGSTFESKRHDGGHSGTWPEVRRQRSHFLLKPLGSISAPGAEIFEQVCNRARESGKIFRVYQEPHPAQDLPVATISYIVPPPDCSTMSSSAGMCLCLSFQKQARTSIERACSEMISTGIQSVTARNLNLASHVRGGATNLCLRCGKPGATRLCQSGCNIAKFCSQDCVKAAMQSHSGRAPYLPGCFPLGSL